MRREYHYYEIRVHIKTQSNYLNDGLVAGNFEHLARSSGSVIQGKLDDLCIFWQLDILEDDERAIYAGNRAVI